MRIIYDTRAANNCAAVNHGTATLPILENILKTVILFLHYIPNNRYSPDMSNEFRKSKIAVKAKSGGRFAESTSASRLGVKTGAKKRQQMIVLMDGAGNYYEVPRKTLERSRVSERRKKKVAAALEDEPSQFAYIRNSTVAGSIATAPKFEGGRQLHYAGHYLSSSKSKR
jgi:hypothetical protein